MGDGSICLRKNNSNGNNRLKISLNSIDDSEYLTYLLELFKDLFNISPIVKYRKDENTVDLFVFRKKFILFLLDEIGLKLSPKWNTAKIPSSFMKNPQDLCVLRGLFDTDGCLVTANNNGVIYPRLEIKICPSPMQEQVLSILDKYGFNYGAYQIGEGKIRIQLNGKKQLIKWINTIGFSNPKHSKKISRFS